MVVDISESQLQMLRSTCADYPTLEVRCLDVADAINSLQVENKQYAIVIAISFLHHVPDYLGLIRQAVTVMSPYGQFFSFQDPLKYDSIGRFTAAFSTLAYLSWRVFKGDVVGGVKRRIRRSRGIYLDDSPEDNAEYHVTRNGVDQAAICDLLGESGFECEIVRYFSTQSHVWQSIGAALGLRNTFAVIAKRIPLS